MGKYIGSDETLKREFLAYDMENDSNGSIGLFLAEAISQRAKSSGKSIEDWLKEDKKLKEPNKSQNNSISDERSIATDIYRAVSSQRLPLKDAGFLVERVLRDNKCKYVPVNGREMPLSKARNFISGYAGYLLAKYGFPSEPADEPNFLVEQ